MGLSNSNPYVYFMYSLEHVSSKDEVEAKLGKRFVCGTVVVGGVKKKYSYKSTNKTFLSQYPDARIIAEGYEKQISFTDCETINKGGN